MKKLLIAIALLAAPLLAQDKIQRLVKLSYADPQAIAPLLRDFGVQMEANREMKVIVLSGLPDRVTTAESAIKQLDVPSAAQKDIELTAYFVVAGDRDTVTGNPIPQDLESVVAQLKNTFPFKNYKMMDALTIRTRSGVPASTTGILSTAANPPLSKFSFRSATAGAEGLIRIDNMRAGLRLPLAHGTEVQYIDTDLETDLDVKEGQKVVVGRSSLEGPDKALFLVLMAKTIN